MTRTLQETYQYIQDRIATVSASSAQTQTESRWAMEKLLNVTQETLLMDGSRRLSESETAQLEDFLYQRTEKRIPIQYLLHEAWFFGLSFYVNPYVLIPRPETELLVEKALKLIKPGMHILDVGTGPGTIALSLSHKLGDTVQISAVDQSPEALSVARINQKMLKTAVFLKPAGDLFAPVEDEQFDFILSNPPYIDHQLKPSLTPEVLAHEPHLALFPPSDDPYYFYHRLAKEGKTHLKPNGHLMVECGAGMSPDITQIFMAQGYKNIKTVHDYAGLDRIVTATYS
jgi:release factor glutamine methyltransferase